MKQKVLCGILHSGRSFTKKKKKSYHWKIRYLSELTWFKSNKLPWDMFIENHMSERYKPLGDMFIKDHITERY